MEETDPIVFAELLRAVLDSEDPLAELPAFETDPAEAPAGESWCACGVTGYGFASRRCVLFVRTPRLLLDFDLPVPSDFATADAQAEGAREIELALRLGWIALANERPGEDRIEAVCVEDLPLEWRIVAPDGTVKSEDDDWGRLADALAVPSGEADGYVIYP